MSIVIKTKDEVLDQLILLEAKRCGFCEAQSPSLCVVDPANFPVPDAERGTLVLAVTDSPVTLSEAERNAVFAVLSLPFSVREFEQAVRRFRECGPARAVYREGEHLLVDGKRIALSAAELRLFDLLYANRDRVVSEVEMQTVLGENAAKTNTVAVYLYRLRRKLKESGIALCTVRGQGCRWIQERR